MVLRALFVSTALLLPSTLAWTSMGLSKPVLSNPNVVSDDDDGNGDGNDRDIPSRRRLLQTTLTVGSLSFLGTLNPVPAQALVKGVAPPPPKKAGGGSDKPKCTNVEECQALAEIREQELREKEEAGPPPKVTASGIRYRDMEDGTGVKVKEGDDVQLYYKVLKIGKRSYDGLSGEGTVVFSRGYGLEDDEDKPFVKSFDTVVGGSSNIIALNEALLGMAVGGTRRFSVLPQKGWRKPIKACDGGPGGSGSGGELKTDYIVVPTATMVEQEACFDMAKQPFPATYAQQRRMAQRFDQSLIMEVQVAKIQ